MWSSPGGQPSQGPHAWERRNDWNWQGGTMHHVLRLPSRQGVPMGLVVNDDMSLASIQPGSAAEYVGAQRFVGLYVTGVNGEPVSDVRTMSTIAEHARAQSEVSLRLSPAPLSGSPFRSRAPHEVSGLPSAASALCPTCGSPSRAAPSGGYAGSGPSSPFRSRGAPAAGGAGGVESEFDGIELRVTSAGGGALGLVLGTDGGGVRLDGVVPGSPADLAAASRFSGLRVTHINGTPVREPRDATAIAEGCSTVLLRFVAPPPYA
eukprot:Hpha_TRINITY_DN17634_c0_g1::TRINITY_DN17634_c0_g1_i1::g.158812::m.158812